MNDLTGARWHKSSRSGGTGDCVEVADLPGVVAVRDSKDTAGPALRFDSDTWSAFVATVKSGAYDPS